MAERVSFLFFFARLDRSHDSTFICTQREILDRGLTGGSCNFRSANPSSFLHVAIRIRGSLGGLFPPTINRGPRAACGTLVTGYFVNWINGRAGRIIDPARNSYVRSSWPFVAAHPPLFFVSDARTHTHTHIHMFIRISFTFFHFLLLVIFLLNFALTY